MLRLRLEIGERVRVGEFDLILREIEGRSAEFDIDAPREIPIVRQNAKNKARRVQGRTHGGAAAATDHHHGGGGGQ